MDWGIIVSVGAALMVVLAVAAYRYYNATAGYALRVRESHARTLQAPAGPSTTETEEEGEEPDEPDSDSDDGATQTAAGERPADPAEDNGVNEAAIDPPDDEPEADDSGEGSDLEDVPVATRMAELDEQLAALPTGLELIELSILERRRIADHREALLSERKRLLAKKRHGAHRRRRAYPKKNL